MIKRSGKTGNKITINQLYGLTDLGNIVKLSVREEVAEEETIKTIEFAVVLNLKTNRFTDQFNKEEYGDIVKQTISANPKDIFDRLSHAKTELEKKELALMKNLFLLGEYPKNIKPRIKKAKKKTENLDE